MKKQILFLMASMLVSHSANAIWSGDNGVSIVGPFTHQKDHGGEEAFLTMGTPLTMLGVRSKLVLGAAEDASYFLVTEGQVETVQLRQAFDSSFSKS